MASMERYAIERDERWTERMLEIPTIQFPASWKVRMIPPFGGAIVRFQVVLPSGVEKSVYLDWYDNLGYYGSPYWEVYPVDGDVGRCDQADVNQLLRLIESDEEESIR